jgi:hypothetical protein
MKVLPLSVPARRLFHLELDPAAFATDWKHCDQISNYLGYVAGVGHTDAYRYSNLLSTVLNELFELAFCHHANDGQLSCTLLRDGPTDRIELEIPVDESGRAFYQQTVAAAQSKQAADLYKRALATATPSEYSAGILELVNDYGAAVSLDDGGLGNVLRLVIDLRLDEPAEKQV